MPADDRIDALFAGPAEGFVAARDALVKELKASGDKEAAAEVKALRRPTVAAWAVNQVARTERSDVAELVRIGDRLRDAHDALLAGQGDGAIRQATAERRRLVARLTTSAVGLLGAGGAGQADAISHTFDAAVADPDAGMAVRAGRLSKELEAPAGFGGGIVFGGGDEPARPRTPKRRRSQLQAEGGAEATARAEAAARAEEAARADEVERRRRRRLEAEAQTRAAEAGEAVSRAEEARGEVRRLLELLSAAESEAERAEAAAATAAEAARRAADEAEQARRDAPAE